MEGSARTGTSINVSMHTLEEEILAYFSLFLHMLGYIPSCRPSPRCHRSRGGGLF